MVNNCSNDKLRGTLRCAWIWLVPLSALTGTVGCGGMDQDDMRKYALNRPSDEELESKPPPKKTVPQPKPTDPAPAEPNTSSQPAPTPQSTPSPTEQGQNTEKSSDRESANASLSDTRPSNTSLSEAERRQTSIDNLNRIAEALEAYHSAKGNYPPQTVYSTAGQPLLSWRVELLPHLGYKSLYQAFKRDEPWNSRHNKALVAKIPSVYQSPERFDTRTNYLLPVGSSTAFASRTTIPPRRWEDGVENTAILVEVDDNLSVEWTQPMDYKIKPNEPTAGLGQLRGDGFFTIWGGGELSMVPSNVGAKDARAMFSVDGGESFSSYTIRKPASATVSQASAPSGNHSTAPNTVTSANSGNTITMATTRSPAADATTPSSASGTLGSDLTQRAIEAFQAGYEAESIDLLMLAHLMDEPSTGIEYRWIPALRRPALAVRYGVGIEYSGPNRDRLKKLRVQKGPNEWSKHSREIRNVSGDLAGQLLDYLEETPRFLPAVFQPEPTKARRGRPATRGIEFLGVTNRQTLQAVAKRRNVDVVAIFQIEERQSRSGKRIREARLRLVDPITRRDLFVSPVINSVKRKQMLGTPLYEDPVDSALRQFESLISDQLQPLPIPSSLRPRHAAKRVSNLRPSSNESPLKALCEIRFYHQQDLLKVDEALAAYQLMLGEEAGLRMLAGKPQQRTEDLQRWTPTVRMTKQARRTTRDDDDDD